MEFPSFTIVIPTFQRRELVYDVVAAIAQIEYRGVLDLIVVVDGSTDETAAALAQITCPCPVRILEQPNSGAASARNRGARLATGDIILFLDDDMVCAPDILEQHAMAFAKGADAVLGDIPLDPTSPAGFLSRAVGKWASERATLLSGAATLGPFEVLTGHLAIRRSVFETLGGFDETFTKGGTWGNEDLDFGVRLIERHRVVFNPKAVSFQRYVVTPRQYMRQWGGSGSADLMFVSKHPDRAKELFELRGASQARTRFAFRPLAALPLVPRSISSAAIYLAERTAGGPRALDVAVGRLFYAAREIVYWSGVRSAVRRVKGAEDVLILCYHAIAGLGDDPVLAEYGIEPSVFANQLDALRKAGANFISAEDLNNYLVSGNPLAPSSILLTFDDCYSELLAVARTILKPRRIPALAFSVSGMRSSTNEWDQAIGAKRLRLLNGEELKELSDLGIEIGSHSRNHQEMPALTDVELRHETLGAARDLQALGLPRPRFFAYPYGACDQRCKAAVRRAGFSAAFGLSRGKVSRATDRYALPRIEILARDTGWRFYLKTRWPRLARGLH